jgi:GAF domain-containing protein
MNQFLSEATRLMSSAGDYRHTLTRLARGIVPPLADFCLIYIVENDDIRLAASAHVTAEGTRLLRALDRVYRIRRDDRDSTVAQVIRTGRSQLRTEIRPEHEKPFDRLTRVFDIHRQLAPRSALVVPIKSRKETFGAMSLSYSKSGRTYTPDEVPILEQLGLQVGLKVDNMRLASVARAREEQCRRVMPALTRLRRCLDQLRARVSREERIRLLGEVARHERTLRRIVDELSAAAEGTQRLSR